MDVTTMFGRLGLDARTATAEALADAASRPPDDFETFAVQTARSQLAVFLHQFGQTNPEDPRGSFVKESYHQCAFRPRH